MAPFQKQKKIWACHSEVSPFLAWLTTIANIQLLCILFFIGFSKEQSKSDQEY